RYGFTKDGRRALSHGFCCQWPEELSHALYPRLLLISAVLAVSSSPRSTAEHGRKRPMPTHRAGAAHRYGLAAAAASLIAQKVDADPGGIGTQLGEHERCYHRGE